MSARKLVSNRDVGFRPTQLNGCVLWLRADLGINLSTGVSQWNDQSAAGLVMAQGTAAAQPSYNPGAIPSLSFTPSGTDTPGQYLASTTTTDKMWNIGTQAFLAWAVIQSPATWFSPHSVHPIFDNSNGNSWAGSSPSNGLGLGTNASGTSAGALTATISGQTANAQSNSNVNPGTTMLVEYQYDGVGTVVLWLNGVVIGGQAVTMGSNTSGLVLIVGGSQGLNRMFSGTLYEMGVYVGSGFNGGHQALQTYALTRYGIGGGQQ